MKQYLSKNVLITGASSGIGKAFAEEFHRRGAQVVLVARRKELLQTIADSLNNERKDSAKVLVKDLSMLSEVKELTDYIRNNQIDILINNAGFGSYGYFESLPFEKEQEMVQVNIAAPLALSHAAIPQMKKRKSGIIINLSSVAGFQPLPYMATYAGTKAFDLWHSIALWSELKSFGVRVLAVCPGPTATEFGGVARVPGTMTGIYRDTVESVVEQTFRALSTNVPFVVTGFRSKLMTLAARYLPLSVTTRVLGWQLGSVLSKVSPST